MSHPAKIDRFQIVRLIGTRYMGDGYEAPDLWIERFVAIKLLQREVLADNPELLQRLFVDARAVNAIGHPRIVQISEAELIDNRTAITSAPAGMGGTEVPCNRGAPQKFPLRTDCPFDYACAGRVGKGGALSFTRRPGRYFGRLARAARLRSESFSVSRPIWLKNFCMRWRGRQVPSTFAVQHVQCRQLCRGSVAFRIVPLTHWNSRTQRK